MHTSEWTTSTCLWLNNNLNLPVYNIYIYRNDVPIWNMYTWGYTVNIHTSTDTQQVNAVPSMKVI